MESAFGEVWARMRTARSSTTSTARIAAFKRGPVPTWPPTAHLGFTVVVDGQKRWESGKMVRGDAPKQVDVDITGAKELRLLVDDAGNDIMGDHADWADAKLLR